MADPAAPAAPVDDDLDLGVNETYRDAINHASQQTGMSPRAVAAVINAEAARGPTGAWDPDSYNSASHAQGLTQFIRGTWLGESQVPGSDLNTASQGLTNQQILDLRTDPNLSISTAAGYDSAGLKSLQDQGLVDKDLTETQSAQYAYLYHHEGPTAASKILKGTFSDADGRRELPSQVGAKQAAKLIDAADGDAAKAYQDWLWGYIHKKIQPDQFKKPYDPPWPWAMPPPGNYQIQDGDPTVLLGVGKWKAAHVGNPHEGGGKIAKGSYTVGVGPLQVPFARAGDATTDPGVVKGPTQPDVLIGGPPSPTTAGAAAKSTSPYGSLPSRQSFGLPASTNPYGSLPSASSFGK